MIIIFSNIGLNKVWALVLSLACMSGMVFGMNPEQLFAHNLTRIESFRHVLPFSRKAMEAFNAFSKAAEKPYFSDVSALVPLECCLGELKTVLISSVKINDEEQRTLLELVKAAHRDAQARVRLSLQQAAPTPDVPQATETPVVFAQHPLAQVTFVGKKAHCVFRDSGQEE